MKCLNPEFWKGTDDNATYDISAAHRAFLLGATRSVAPQSTNQSMGSGATHRSRVDSARAHVCTPAHMNVSINTTFERPSSTAAQPIRYRRRRRSLAC